MALSIDPRPALRTAPTVITAAYAALVVQALLVLACAATAGALFGVTAPWWLIVLLVLAGIVLLDNATVVAKGRPFGRWVTLVASAGWFAFAGMHLAAHPVSSGAAIIVSALALALVFLPPASRAHFAANKGASLIGMLRQASPDAAAAAAAATTAARPVPQDYKGHRTPKSATSQEKAKQAAVDAAVAKFGPGIADKAAEIADKVLSDQKDARTQTLVAEASAASGADTAEAGIDTAALNRQQRRALERAKRTGKAPQVVQRKKA